MQRTGGFSLLELMAVIAIMGILVSLAIPGFGYLAANTKVKSASTELYLAMIRARSESVKRNRAVTVTANAAGWQAGWQIIVDGNNDGDFADVAANVDRLVLNQGALQRVTVNLDDDANADTAFGAAEDDTSVVFRPTGRIAGAAPFFDVASDDDDHPMRRCISTDLTGRPYTKPEVCP